MYRLDHSDPLLRRDILARLSALLDSGRWYFPNRHAEQIGSHKPAAYRGLRQPVLDAIFAAYDCIRDERPECGDKLESIQRRSEEHTSELQSLMRISYAVFCLKKKK